MAENKVCYRKMMEEIDIIMNDKSIKNKEAHGGVSDLETFRELLDLRYTVIDNIIHGGDLEENLNILRNFNV